MRSWGSAAELGHSLRDTSGTQLLTAQQRIEPVNGSIRAVLEQAPVAGQGERNAVVTGPLGDLPDIAPGRDQDGHEAVPQPVEGEPRHRRAKGTADPELTRLAMNCRAIA